MSLCVRPGLTLPPFPFPCRLVVLLQQYITLTLYQQQAITRGVEEATRALGFIHRANDARYGSHTCGVRCSHYLCAAM